MTATDSSHLEPDIDRSASPPVESANSIGDGSESASGPIKSAQPPAALLAREEPVELLLPGGPDDRPRATRVAEGAWVRRSLHRTSQTPWLAGDGCEDRLRCLGDLPIHRSPRVRGLVAVIAARVDCESSRAGVCKPCRHEHPAGPSVGLTGACCWLWLLWASACC